MNMQMILRNGHQIAVIDGSEKLIVDPQSALDLFMTVKYESGATRIALHKDALLDEFFDLSTRIAGEVLQKIINYQLKLAIYGDFSGYKSKSLNEFIFESNQGNAIFFLASAEDAVKRLSLA